MKSIINQKIYKQLVRGLEQYIWYLGQDTKDHKNNLLKKYGFRRYRVKWHGGSGRYKKRWGSKIVELHSFCVGMYSKKEDGFLFVRAHDKAYAYCGKKPPMPGRYRKTFLIFPLGKENKLRFYHASCEFLEWLEDYEAWIEKTYGKAYRSSCFKRYHDKWLSPAKAREWFKKYRELKNGGNKKDLLNLS